MSAQTLSVAGPPARRTRTTTALLAITCVVVAGVALALLVAFGSAGSSRTAIGPREPSLPGSALASGITAQTNGRAQNVSCPDLPARAGASVVCGATVDGAPAHIRTTITSMQGTRAQYSFAQVP